MKLLYLSLLIALAKGETCDENGIIIYEDLGCTPTNNDTKCPSKYACIGLEKTRDKCHFRGKTYEHLERVDSELSTPSCDEACTCFAEKNKAGFNCAILDCPEWLGVPVPVGCYRNYTLGSCCSVGAICPPFDDIEKCSVDGKEYREGEKFYPSNTCLDCVCLKGFSGKLEEPFCRRRRCGQQLKYGDKIQNLCAPFYSKQLNEKLLCCPDNWLCPDGSEKIEGDSKSDETCKFGEKSLKVGEYFERSNFADNYGRSFKKVRCECVIPPLLKCVDI